MNEEELKAKEEELNNREALLNERENILNAIKEEINDKNEDTGNLVKQVKDEYEAKMLKQHDTYEKRLKEREAVIKQLLSNDGEANTPPQNTIVDKINARRHAQNKKW